MGDHGTLIYGLVILGAAVVIVSLFRRLKLSPLLGYLAAGSIIGPFGLGLVDDGPAISMLGEFGVLFLLFMIGLELPIDRLKALRRYVFALGSSQIVVTGAALSAMAWFAGLPPYAAVTVGAALSLSSTATVLQLLSERGELLQRFGRVSLAVLLMQDLAVAPFLAVLPFLAARSVDAGDPAYILAAKAIGALVVIFLLGRFVARPALRIVGSSRTPELFTASSLLIVVGTSFLTAEAGLSMALGAFLAGMLLADTEYRHQVEADILPFRGLFLGLFFMTVGMRLDAHIMIDEAGLIGLLLVVLLGTKAVILFLLCRAFSLPVSSAIRTGFALSQAGEFAFVLIGLAMTAGIVPAYEGQVVFVTVALGIVATPFMLHLGRKLTVGIDAREATRAGSLEGEAHDLAGHVVIAGFGRVGQTVGELLHDQEIPYVVIEFDHRIVMDARKRGLPVFFGNASQASVMESAGVGRARAAVITLDQTKPAEHLVHNLRSHYPDLPIIARARDLKAADMLEKAGASNVVPETIEASLRLGATVLKAAGKSQEEIRELMIGLTADDYRVLRDRVSCLETEVTEGSKKLPRNKS